METYRDLLEKPEWKNKRKIILKRDENRCVNCDNLHLVENLEVGILVSFMGRHSILKEKKEVSLLIDKVGGSSPDAGGKVRVFNEVNLIETEHYVVYYQLNSDDNRYVKPVIGIVHNNEKIKGFTLEHLILFGFAKRLLLERDFLMNSTWIYAVGLHIHHTYYQEGLLPWEYPNESLQTLCWHCHEELHKNEKVPYLNTQGIECGKLTPCLRCFGSGYLPQYYYYLGGVCFRCNGARFEEMIGSVK